MRIDSLESIWNNMGYVIQKHNNYKKTKRNLRNLVYNCAPKHMKDGSIKNTFIEVGYLYLTSAVKDDSQGFIRFDCTDHINYDKEHKIIFPTMPAQFWDKLVGKHNTNIAQLYNDKTKEYLHKDSNIEWNIVKGQALFTTRKEAEDYIKQCENGEIELPEFFLKVEKVMTNPTREDYENIEK